MSRLSIAGFIDMVYGAKDSIQEQIGGAMAERVIGSGLELTPEQKKKLASDMAGHMAMSLVPLPAEDLELDFEAKSWTGTVSGNVVRLDAVAISGMQYWALDFSTLASGFQIRTLSIDRIQVMTREQVIKASASIEDLRVEGGAPAVVPYIGKAIGKVMSYWDGGTASALANALSEAVKVELVAVAQFSVGKTRVTVDEIVTAGVDRLEEDGTMTEVQPTEVREGPDVQLEGAAVTGALSKRGSGFVGIRVDGFSGVMDGVSVAFSALGTVEAKTLDGRLEVETLELSSVRITRDGEPAVTIDAAVAISDLSVAIGTNALATFGKAVAAGLAKAVWEALKTAVGTRSASEAKEAFGQAFKTSAVTRVQESLVAVLRAEVGSVTVVVNAMTLDGSLEAGAVLSVADTYLQAAYVGGEVAVTAGGEATLAITGHADTTLRGIQAVVDGDATLRGSVAEGVMAVPAVTATFTVDRAEGPAIHAAGKLMLRDMQLQVDAANDSLLDVASNVLSTAAGAVFASQLPVGGAGPQMGGMVVSARNALVGEVERSLPGALSSSLRATIASIALEITEFTVDGVVTEGGAAAEVTDVSAGVSVQDGAVVVEDPQAKIDVLLGADVNTMIKGFGVTVSGGGALSGDLAEGRIAIEMAGVEFSVAKDGDPHVLIEGRLRLEDLGLNAHGDHAGATRLLAAVIGSSADAAIAAAVPGDGTINPRAASPAAASAIKTELERRVPGELRSGLSASVRAIRVDITRAMVTSEESDLTAEAGLEFAITDAAVGVDVDHGSVDVLDPTGTLTIALAGEGKATKSGTTVAVDGDTRIVGSVADGFVAVERLGAHFLITRTEDPSLRVEGNLELVQLALGVDHTQNSTLFSVVAGAIGSAAESAAGATLGEGATVEPNPSAAADAFVTRLTSELETRVPADLSTTLSARVERATVRLTTAMIRGEALGGHATGRAKVELTDASLGVDVAEGTVTPRTSGELTIRAKAKGRFHGVAVEVKGDAKPTVDFGEGSIGIRRLRIKSFKAVKPDGERPITAKGSMELKNLTLTSEASGQQIYETVADAVGEALAAAFMVVAGLGEGDDVAGVAKSVLLGTLETAIPARLGKIKARIGSLTVTLEEASVGEIALGGGVTATDVQLTVDPGDLAALDLDVEGQVALHNILLSKGGSAAAHVSDLTLDLDDHGTGHIIAHFHLVSTELGEAIGGKVGKLVKALTKKSDPITFRVPILNYAVQLGGLFLSIPKHGKIESFIRSHLLENIRVSSDGSLKVSSFKKNLVTKTQEDLGVSAAATPAEQTVLIPKNVPGGNAVNLKAFAKEIIQARLDAILAGPVEEEGAVVG